MTFRYLIPEYFPDFNTEKFKWNVGKIDQQIQSERFTPIYKANVGVENNKLMTKSQFLKNWDLCYDKAKLKK